MKTVRYQWTDGHGTHACEFAHVRGTHGRPYVFGDGPDQRSIEVDDFLIGTVPVTQALWTHIMGADTNPALHRADQLPLENISWDDVTKPGGFLQCLNEGQHGATIKHLLPPTYEFRLPTETEWEYAARGGAHWNDRFRFSGSDDIDAVAWYYQKHGDHTQPVGQKAPNQLGLYDMSGNVAVHCTVFKRYEIGRSFHDGCIGVRFVLSSAVNGIV